MATEAPTRRPKPLPLSDRDTAPFWEGTLQGELRLQRCLTCGAVHHPPSPYCPECLSPEQEWFAASGRGSVYTFVVVHQALNPAWAGDVPYVVAVVELEEGPHLLTNVVETPHENVRIGLPVEVCFDRVSDEVALPKFRPSPNA